MATKAQYRAALEALVSHILGECPDEVEPGEEHVGDEIAAVRSGSAFKAAHALVSKKVKVPAHTCPKYVCARLRKILAAQGWPLSKGLVEGYEVQKVGCSKTVSIKYWGTRRPYHRRTDLEEKAWALLRSMGYRVDEKGYVECDYHD